MKKVIAILSVFLLSATLTFGQYLTPFRVASTSVAFGKTVPLGTTIDYGSASYYTTALTGASQTLQGMITAGTAKLKSGNVTDSLYLHSTGIDKAYGNYHFYGTNVFTTATVSTTLTLPGTANTLTKKTGNANCVSFAHSLFATDTVFAPTLSTSGNATVSGTFHAVGVTTLDASLVGNSNIRGSAAFSGTLTRVAVSIPGALTTDYYVVRQVSADSHTRPVAGDLLSCFAVNDSLIVLRAVGTTSGETFTYFRIK